jgi:type IV secretory pathway TrbL component
MRLRVAGSDVTTSSYVRGLLSVRSSGATFTFSDTGATNFGINNVNSPAQGRASGVLDFDSPFISSQTTISGHSVGHDTTSVFFSISGFQHTTAASYTGLTFFPSAGTFLGEVQVFGYNE